MLPDVYSKSGMERSWEWLTEIFGDVHHLEAPDNSDRFRLVRVDETEGPATIQVRVLGPSGEPWPNQPVAVWWPDRTLPDLRQAGLVRLWRERGVNQRTDNSGTTGFGLGNGSYYFPPNVGPHVVWVLSPSSDSDGVEGIGMLSGTNHRGPLRLTFQLTHAQGQDPKPEPEPGTPNMDQLIQLAVPMMASDMTAEMIAARALSVYSKLAGG